MANVTETKSSPAKCKGTCGMRRMLNAEKLCRQCAPMLGTLPAPRETPTTTPPIPCQGVSKPDLIVVATDGESPSAVLGDPSVGKTDAALAAYQRAGIEVVTLNAAPTVAVTFARMPRFPGLTGNSRDRRRQIRARKAQSLAA